MAAELARPAVGGTNRDVAAASSTPPHVQLALRLMARLASVGPPLESGLGRDGATQRGLAHALGASQGAVSKVLRQLTRLALVRSERQHVPGRLLRVTVYSLTRRGELWVQAAREKATSASTRR